MKIEVVQQIIEPYIGKPIIDFIIEKQIFSVYNCRKILNKIIREKVDKKFGIYIWVNNYQFNQRDKIKLQQKS